MNGMTLKEMRSFLQDLVGTDLSNAEANRLINQSMRRLARKSRYPRKTLTFDTVAAEGSYDLPADWVAPVTITVNGSPFKGSDSTEVANLNLNYLSTDERGFWFLDGDQGTINLWPTPSEVLPVAVKYLYLPEDLILDAATPDAFPVDYHEGILFGVLATYYRTVEDNPDLAAVNKDLFEEQAAELKQERNSEETGDETFYFSIQGITGL